MLKTALIGALFFTLPPQDIGPEIGKPAPDFELKDSTGRAYKLAEFRGRRNVVLEFFRSGSW